MRGCGFGLGQSRSLDLTPLCYIQSLDAMAGSAYLTKDC